MTAGPVETFDTLIVKSHKQLAPQSPGTEEDGRGGDGGASVSSSVLADNFEKQLECELENVRLQTQRIVVQVNGLHVCDAVLL